jgi:methylmalonyl-CoA mutase
VRRLQQVRGSRDAAAVTAALAALTTAARAAPGDPASRENLLELAVTAARARASVGEISAALEQVWGRHRAVIHSVSGVYASAYAGDERFRAIQDDVARFAKDEGRRPRLLVVKLGQDGHDRGAKVIATAFADMGYDVDIGPLFQTPEEAARHAIENDAHVVGVSSQAAGHKTLVPQLIEALRAQGAADILVVCGGVIPPQDHEYLRRAGVAAIYGPGTNITLAAGEVLELIRRRR